jgi:hypothetical protein
MERRAYWVLSAVVITLAASLACGGQPGPSSPSELPPTSAPPSTPAPTAEPVIDRQAKIPADAVKMSPETDEHPPEVLVDDYEQPVPVPGRVNTAGAEDSPFITPDGETLYFFFTPDVRVPVEKQILDGVTGIYESVLIEGEWGEPERIMLQDPGKLAGDGCEFVQGDVMWFCSVREGYTGVHWFTAERVDGKWQNWTNADFDPAYQVGELHITPDGKALYFGSDRPGGQGGLDIWVSRWGDGEWQEPVDVVAVNTPDSEGWPAISPDGRELWFSRNYGIWRSRMVDGGWGEPELVVSPLAGEPSIDAAGNLYFVHHFFSGDVMIEADIYVARKK